MKLGNIMTEEEVQQAKKDIDEVLGRAKLEISNSNSIEYIMSVISAMKPLSDAVLEGKDGRGRY